tara:strand:- start:951 stop:1229 length:279 start_codon:yes stop_codon:yes gene_type:complete
LVYHDENKIILMKKDQRFFFVILGTTKPVNVASALFPSLSAHGNFDLFQLDTIPTRQIKRLKINHEKPLSRQVRNGASNRSGFSSTRFSECP